MSAADYLAALPGWLAEVRKFLVATAAGCTMILSTGLLHGPVGTWVNAVIAVLGAVGVYRVPNADPPKEPVVSVSYAASTLDVPLPASATPPPTITPTATAYLTITPSDPPGPGTGSGRVIPPTPPLPPRTG